MATHTRDTLKARCWQFDDALFNRGDLAAAAALLAPDFVNHVPGAPPVRPEAAGPEPTPAPAALGAFLGPLRAAFPDLVFANEALLAEGDFVAHRVALTGTHRGPYLGVQATGRRVTIRSHDFQRWSEGRLAERWSIVDVADLLRQLGRG